MKFILKDSYKEMEVPQNSLQIKLIESATSNQISELKSSLQSKIDTDNVQIFNFRELRSMTLETCDSTTLFADLLVVLLFILSFY